MENVIVVEHYCEGEGMYFIKEITLEELNKIEEIVGTDFTDDLTLEHPIKIKLLTSEQNREALISGTAFGEGCSEELARRIVDGEGLLSEEEEDAQLNKQMLGE